MTSKKSTPPLHNEQMFEMLVSMNERINSAPALNGGFDKMLATVEVLVVSQEEMKDKVNNIHTAIYDPENGLFTRVKEIEHVKDKTQHVDKMKFDIEVIQRRDDDTKVEMQTLSKETLSTQKKMDEVEHEVKELVKFTSKVQSALKWFVFTAGGALLTLIGKLLYDVLSGHVKIH